MKASQAVVVLVPSPGGGGIPLYKPYRRYVPLQRVRFLRRFEFGLKTGI